MDAIGLKRTAVTAAGVEAFKQRRIALGKRPFITVTFGDDPD